MAQELPSDDDWKTVPHRRQRHGPRETDGRKTQGVRSSSENHIEQLVIPSYGSPMVNEASSSLRTWASIAQTSISGVQLHDSNSPMEWTRQKKVDNQQKFTENQFFLGQQSIEKNVIMISSSSSQLDNTLELNTALRNNNITAQHIRNSNNFRPNNTSSRESYAKRMMKYEPEKLLDNLVKGRKFLINELQNDAIMTVDYIQDIISMLAKACQCENNNDGISELLSIVNDKSNFLQSHLLNFFSHYLTKPDESIPAFQSLLFVMRSLMTYLPMSSAESVTTLMAQLNAVKRLHNTNTKLTELFNEIHFLEQLHDGIVKAAGNKLLKGRDRVALDREAWETPNDNFRNIPVLPTEILLQNTDTSRLRQNRIAGGYNDIEHYLDVQFRLLHEDFLRPLRDGIDEYRRFLDNAAKFGHDNRQYFRHDDLRVYENVHIKGVEGGDIGATWLISFDVQRMRQSSWHKRLLFGNLVCFSNNNFKTISFGTVSNRKEENLQKGEVSVYLDRENMFKFVVEPYQQMKMIEPSSSYFVAYKSVLDGLKEMQQIPFETYLVKVKLDIINAPVYLRRQSEILEDNCTKNEMDSELSFGWSNEFGDEWSINITEEKNNHNTQSAKIVNNLSNTFRGLTVSVNKDSCKKYDFGLFFPPVKKIVTSSLPQHSTWGTQHVSIPRLIYEEKLVDVLQVESWPSADDLKLDKSQYRALQDAVTKELSVIQGPPGTGKTFIGLKLVQLLLQNKKVWQVDDYYKRKKGPILVVCYTNHALDQFLEGVIKMNGLDTKLIRVGSRSKSSLLEPYSLHKHRKSFFNKEQRDILDKIEIKLIQEFEKLPKNAKIFNYSALKSVILPEHKQSLLLWAPSHEDCIIGHWLCMDDDENEANAIAECSSTKKPERKVNTEHIAEERNQPKDKIMDEYQREEARRELEERLIEEDDNATEGKKNTLQNKTKKKKKTKRHVQNDGRKIPAVKCKQEKRLRGMVEFLNANEFLTDEEELLIDDVWKLRQRDRWRLYRFWMREAFYMQSITLRDLFDRYEEEAGRKKAAQLDADMRVLQTADIVGMTTTGAANYRHVLQHVRPKIIIVEEAAEILEAHVVTVMSPFTEHLVLIGDHQQLRPKVTVNELGSKYHLEISLFERLVESGINFVRLQSQHRMRSEIAALICPLIYQDLENAEKVKQYDHVKGMREDMFFLHHNMPEGTDNGTKSYHNEYEAAFITHFYCYLLQQGYKETQITILTPYIGQMVCLKRAFAELQHNGSIPKNIKVVDDYQGEENDIIIVSLVRSNNSKTIGFLKQPNRTCVLLSRAKIGMYLIGNADHFKRSSELWHAVVSVLEENKRVGNFLPLQCQFHLDKPSMFVHHYNDFARMSNGLCNQRCDIKLTCGHLCSRPCHRKDREHKRLPCREMCNRLCQAELHACQKSCGEDCGDCKERVETTLDKCGHKQLIHCHQDPKDVKCNNQCEKKCEFGHQCTRKCHQKCQPCMSLIEKTIAGCGHKQDVPCSSRPSREHCQHPCERKCEHGHICPKKCAEECGSCSVQVEKVIPRCSHTQMMLCSTSPKNAVCHFITEKILPRCGHSQLMECSQNPCDVVCQQACERKCSNGHVCPALCSTKCPPCEEKVDKIVPKCEHVQNVSCHKSPESIRCIHSCDKLCPNGHQCLHACYETPCPPCNVKVDKVIPSCGHIQKVPCHVDVKTLICHEACNRTCSQGHKCSGQCSEPCEPCVKMVQKKLPKCSHYCNIPCSVSPEKYKCEESCERTCDQGHKCPKKCSNKCGQCNVMVTKSLPRCCHEQEVPCGVKPENAVCKQKCLFELKCGHLCDKKCGDPEHTKLTECKANVEKTLKCGHEAMTTCCESVDKVKCQKVVFVKLECGHDHNPRCHDSKKITCNKLKMVDLSCGHKVEIPCNEIHSYKCQEKVTKKLSCGHAMEIYCSERNKNVQCTFQIDTVCTRWHKKSIPCHKAGKVGPCSEYVTIACKQNKTHSFTVKCHESFNVDIPCPQKCETSKNCGHPCNDTCLNCTKNGSHLMCIQKQDVDLPCGHSSYTYCFGLTLPCKDICDFQCTHYECDHSCSEFCSECSKPCEWSCDHYRCTKICSEFCDRPPCEMPCPKKLACKHACPGFCGEPCPKVCFQCDQRYIRRLELYSKTKITANTRLLLLQPCGCIVEDQYMKLHVEKCCQLDFNGLHSISPLSCPRCEEAVMICPRYGNIIKTYVNAVNATREQILQQSLAAFVLREQSSFHSFFKLLNESHSFRRLIQSALCALNMARRLITLLNRMAERDMLPHPPHFLRKDVEKNEKQICEILSCTRDFLPTKKVQTNGKANEFGGTGGQKLFEETEEIKFKFMKLYLEKKLLLQKREQKLTTSTSNSKILDDLVQNVSHAGFSYESLLGGLHEQELLEILPKTNLIIQQELEVFGKGPQTWKMCDNGLYTR